MNKPKIGIFTGSLRKESFCKKTARVISGMLNDSFDIKSMEIGNLVIFNQDYDDEDRPPAEWQKFREEVKSLDGFLFVTPEYNRSFPPVLKNALDIASRPYGQNVWSGKPGAVISVTPGKLGAFGANQQLRQTLMFLNIFLMLQPEAYIGDAASLFDEKGELINEGTKKFLQDYADEFVRWVKKFTEKKV
ncbi:MAG: NAD(P)H-dependent oxidoreductase [Treponema sp.]|jgi:chromate reductase|nr:NAD(P)H-dependent oxidoreductase [Treponema sp.]